MANVKISELRANTNPSGQEELAYAKNGSNGKITLNTIKSFVGQGGGGGGGGGENPANKTQEIFAPGVLPDSRESNTWIFTSNGMHGVEFDGSQAKVYEMATAFDVDGENTLLTTVTAPGDINMGLLNDEGTRLILLGYKSSWRIMYGTYPDEGGEAFMFDPNSPEYTYNEYVDRGEQVPYFKSTTDLTSGDYAGNNVFSNAKGESVHFSDLKFIGMTYHDWSYWYVYCPETDEYGRLVVGNAEWNNPGNGSTEHDLSQTRITSVLDLGDGRGGPTYMYGDPLQTGTDGWYRVSTYSGYHRPSYPNSEDQFFADGNGSIGTMNDTIQFIGGNQRYISSDRYLGYNTTKQIVTTYNVKGYGNTDPDDTINVPSNTRFTGEIGNLQNNKQDKLLGSPEFISHKTTKANPTPWIEAEKFYADGLLYSVSFYQNGTVALLSSAYTCYCGGVTNPYEITQEEFIDIYNSNNSISIEDSIGQAFLSEDGYKLIAKVSNSQHIRVYNLDTPFNLTSSQTVDSYDVGTDAYIFNYDGTALWKWEYDENDDHDYWNLYTGSDYEYDQFTLQGHQGDIDFTGNGNYLFCIALSFDGKYLIAGNLGGSGKGIVLYKLSTPWDLSTAILSQTLEYADGNFRNCYCGIPTEDFVYVAWRGPSSQDNYMRKYSYDPAIAYPSMEGVINGVADAYKPVEGTIDNGTVTISGTQLYTKLTDVDSNITIQYTNVIPGMRYVVYGNVVDTVDVAEDSNTVFQASTLQLNSGDKFLMEVTALEENYVVNWVGAQVMPVNP